MKKLFEKLSEIFCSRNARKIMFLSSMVISIICLIVLFTISPKEDENLQKQITDLQKKSEALLKEQQKYDSAIKSQEAYVASLENKIANIKEKTTIIKEYYTRIQEKASVYDTKQVDSFFRKKYNY